MSAKVLPYLPQVRQSTSYSLVMSDNVLHKDPKCPYPTKVLQGTQPNLDISTRNRVTFYYIRILSQVTFYLRILSILIHLRYHKKQGLNIITTWLLPAVHS